MKRRRPSPPAALALSSLLALAAALAAAPPAPGQAPAAAPPASGSQQEAGQQAGGQPEIFVDSVEVSVVNVEVYVTDKQGNRVTGLTKDDFEVFEDRRPVQVTNFYAVENGVPEREFAPLQVTADVPEPIPVPPPAAAAAPAAPEIPEDQRLNLIVYVDNYNLRPYNRNRVLRELRVFLGEQVRVGDRVMLVSYDRSLTIRRPFTTDPQAIGSALVELETMTGHAASRDQDQRDILKRVQDARSPSEALTWARGYAEEIENNLRFSVDALKEMVSWLAGLSGRKAIVYLSDGVPMVPGQEVFHAVDGLHGGQSGAITESLGYDASRLFQELAAQANANRVTFYTIDAAGLRVDSSIDVENQRAQSVSVSSIDTHNVQAPLRYVADATGGLAIMNRNKVLPALEQVASDFQTYYSLGYRAPEAGRGRYHKIEVKVKGRGLLVRHRDGYRDKTVEARMTDGTVSALRFDLGGNPIRASVTFGQPSPREGRLYAVPVEVRIPIGNMALIPRADTHEARLRLFIAAKDSEGDASPVQQVGVPVTIPSAEVEHARGQNYIYRVELLMRGGEHRVAVGVRDDLAGTESFVTRDLRVGTAAPASVGRLGGGGR